MLRDAWTRGQTVQVHGWIYSLADGLVRELGADMAREDEVHDRYEASVARILRGC